MTDNQSPSRTWVSGVQYGPANEMTQISYGYPFNLVTETRTYNTRLQLTRLTVAGVMDLEYRYSPTQNNGKITQQKDWISGEEVTYTYDSLQRLIAAVTTDPSWGLSFGYDGFGNKVSQTVTKGSGPTMSVVADPATNRLVGFGYDANGNLTNLPGTGAFSYDIENRVVVADRGQGMARRSRRQRGQSRSG